MPRKTSHETGVQRPARTSALGVLLCMFLCVLFVARDTGSEAAEKYGEEKKTWKLLVNIIFNINLSES